MQFSQTNLVILQSAQPVLPINIQPNIPTQNRVIQNNNNIASKTVRPVKLLQNWT